MRELIMAAVAGSIATLALIAPAGADNSKQMILLPDASAVKWAAAPPSLPKGTQLAVLVGDPSKPGPFVLRVKFPPNTTVAPHTHATAENLTVISGVIFHEMGPALKKDAGQQLSSGGFVYLPSEMPHSVWTTSEPTEIQVTGTGPFGLQYINPADDPSKTQ